MPLIKKLAVTIWKSVAEDFGNIFKIAMKSLFYGPAF